MRAVSFAILMCVSCATVPITPADCERSCGRFGVKKFSSERCECQDAAWFERMEKCENKLKKASAPLGLTWQDAWGYDDLIPHVDGMTFRADPKLNIVLTPNVMREDAPDLRMPDGTVIPGCLYSFKGCPNASR